MFEFDSWIDWEPDPERASQAAAPNLEPYASLSKRQILGLMLKAKGGREWEFLQEYFLNKCTDAELALAPLEFIRNEYRVFTREERLFLAESVVLALRRRSDHPHQPNPHDDDNSSNLSDPSPDRTSPSYHHSRWPFTLTSNHGDHTTRF